MRAHGGGGYILTRLIPVYLADNNFYNYYLVMTYPEMCKSIIVLSPAALAQTDHNRLVFADMWNSFVLGREAEEVMNAFFGVFFGTRAHYDRQFKQDFFAYWTSVVEPDPALRSHYFAQWICALCTRKAFEIEDVKERWTTPTCLASGADCKHGRARSIGHGSKLKLHRLVVVHPTGTNPRPEEICID